MSSSISPWLIEYIIGLAEEYGGDTSKFPEIGKKKSVQLTKFIFYGSTNPKELSPIWAQVSDKVLEIPVKFSSESVAAYVQEHKSRLTQNRTCLIKLKKYKLSFGRIPIRKTSHPNLNANNLSRDPFLFLNVTDFEVMGSINEDVWCKDTLKSMEEHVEIKEWVIGLRKGGGDGNILKLRRKEREAQKPLPECKPQAKQTRLAVMPVRAEASKPKLKPLPKATTNDVNMKGESEFFARQRERYWNRYSKYPQANTIPPDHYAGLRGLQFYGEIAPEGSIDSTRDTTEGSPKKRKRKVNPLDLGSSQPEPEPHVPQLELEKNVAEVNVKTTQTKHTDLGSSQRQKEEQQSGRSNGTQPSQQATPPPSEPAHESEPDAEIESERGYSPAPSSTPLTDWSSSPRGSPAPEDVQILGRSSPCHSGAARSYSPSRSPSPLVAPAPFASSLTAPTPAQRRRMSYSSPDLSRRNREFSHRSNSSPSCVMGTYRSSALDPRMYEGMVRVVSPPPQPGRSPVDPDASPKVLVPCSDGGSQSQSQGLSWESQEHVAVKEESVEIVYQDDAAAESQKTSLPRSSMHLQQDLQGGKRRSLPFPITRKGVKPSQESIVPETQPKPKPDSETEDEEVEEIGAKRNPQFTWVANAQSQALSQEQEDSLEVHPGTPGEDTCSEQPRTAARDDLGQKESVGTGSGPSQPQVDKDDDQTMEFLFGAYQSPAREREPKAPHLSPAREKEEAIHFIPHDVTAWKQPAFMKRSAITSNSRPSKKTISPQKTLPAERQPAIASKAGSNHDSGSVIQNKQHSVGPSALACSTTASSSQQQLDMVPAQPMEIEADGNRAVDVKARGKKRAVDIDDDATGEAECPARKKAKVNVSEVRPPKGKLNGFSLQLDNRSASGSLVTWDRLQAILLKTGRERSKQYSREGLQR